MTRRATLTRREIIASYAYGTRGEGTTRLADATSADGGSVGDGKTDRADVTTSDEAVDAAIVGLEAALAKLEAAQQADPGVETDPNDKPVNDDIAALRTTLEKLKADQAVDAKSDEDAKPDAEPKPADDATPPPADPSTPPAPNAAGATGAAFTLATIERHAAAMPVTNPIDENGNVHPDVTCANPDCQHLASVHENTDEGDNQGHCQTPDCDCPGMQVASQTTAPDDSDADDDGGEGGGAPEDPANAPDGEAAKLAIDVATAPDADPTAQNAPPEMTGGEVQGPAFTIPCGLILGQPTGDGRSIAVDAAIDWRVPPVPLMGMLTDTHDPNGWDMNDPALLIGHIDSFEIVPGEGSTKIVTAKGFFLPDEDSLAMADKLEAMGRLGISADVAVDESEVTVEEMDPDGWPMEMSETLTKGTIMAMTMLPMAAFAGCYIVLDSAMPEAEPIPQSAPADASDAIVASAARSKPHFLSYSECEPCAAGMDVMVASGGPERPPASWFANPNFMEGDGRLAEILDRRGKRAYGGKFACPITVTEDGEVYGHIAAWGVCHTGVSGECILAPRSQTDYAFFKRGQHVITAEGEKIRVGVLTAGIGHAPKNYTGPQTMAHYDDTRLACANVNIGEDAYGIWVHGALKPGATAEQIDTLRTSSPSGDWRREGGNLELHAALCVNQPGFTLAVVAGGQVQTLVAAGFLWRGNVEDADVPDDGLPSWARGPLLRLAKIDARERLTAA